MAPAHRDDGALARGLARWLADHRGLPDPAVESVSRPAAGYSARRSSPT